MRKAGFCSRCNASVWLAEGGQCSNGHSADCISDTYEVQEDDPVPKAVNTEVQEPVARDHSIGLSLKIGFAVAAQLALLTGCCAVASVLWPSANGPKVTLLSPRGPKVTIVSPRPGSTVNTRFVTLKARADAKDAEILVNGSPSGRVELVEGKNTISIKATDKSTGETTVQKTTLLYAIPKPKLVVSPDWADSTVERHVYASGTVNDWGISVVATNRRLGKKGAAVAKVDELDWSAEAIPLLPGVNPIVLLAKNKSGQDVKTITVTCRPECDVGIMSPGDGKRLAREQVTVRGEATPKALLACKGRVCRADKWGRYSMVVPLRKGENKLTIVASKPYYAKSWVTVSVTRVETPAEFKAGCREIPYKVLDKEADNIVGRRVRYTGQVLNVEEDLGETIIQLYVTDMGYDVWTDQVLVRYPRRVRVYSDDIITVYGTVAGSETYTSQAGWDVTVPSVNARFISE